jgi:hypothetical protein
MYNPYAGRLILIRYAQLEQEARQARLVSAAGRHRRLSQFRRAQTGESSVAVGQESWTTIRPRTRRSTVA